MDKDHRKWLNNTGKGHVLDFSDAQVRELKTCFDCLDENNSGDIGLDDLKAPLIGLGFASNISEVEKLVLDVDLDGSGEIEFPEFLGIVRQKPNQEEERQGSEMTGFFKKLTTGEIGSRDLSFSMFVANEKRKDLMNALTKQRGSEL